MPTCSECSLYQAVNLKEVPVVQGVVLEGPWGECHRECFASLACMANLTRAGEASCAAFKTKEPSCEPS